MKDAPKRSVHQPRGIPDTPLRVRSAIVLGFAIVGLFFGVLGVWGAVAPLESAAIASGSVSVDSNRKTIQHLEGGIVAKIYVRDGDIVQPGQSLIRLDATRPKAALEMLRGRLLASQVLEARLIAERDGSKKIAFPKILMDERRNPGKKGAIDGQIKILTSRREALDGQIGIQRRRIAQVKEEVRGLEGQIDAETIQLKLIGTEIQDLQNLVAKGWARKPRLLALKRRSAEIMGSLSRNRARIARASQSIAEIRLRIGDLRTTVVNQAVAELREVQSELFDLAERIRAAEDVLNRTKIIAPLAGIVVGLQVHTTGGVISPGEPLLHIVPSDDRLIIEARIDPSDIDVVHPGLDAHVRLTPLSARNTVPLSGTVASLSADRLTDERTGHAYYLARIELEKPPKSERDRRNLYPGMPAEVMIVTGTRTALGYLLSPFSSSLRRAFREQ